jgi:Protein of unknown function (DUF3551)
MNQPLSHLLKLSAMPIAALSALAFMTVATPASANPHEYCRRDITEYGALSCGFETMAQCQAMASGRGGDCLRDPSLSTATSAYAYAPGGQRQHRRK